jgi:class 3 adenylate cyclase
VLVSNVVHELVAGPGIDFHETREVQLKGFSGSHRLYLVDLAQTDQPPAIVEQLGPDG